MKTESNKSKKGSISSNETNRNTPFFSSENLITVTISIIALILSVVSFYFQFFWENHEIYFAVTGGAINITKTELKLVILNEGNKSEYIHSFKIIYSRHQALTDTLEIFECDIKPIHIKVGEKVPITIFEPTGAGNLDQTKLIDSSKIINIGLIIDYVGSKGFIRQQKTLIGDYSTQKKVGKISKRQMQLVIQ